MAQEKWSERLTARIGANLQELRKSSGRSAQELADATAELGEEIPRQVITNLENGRRSSISIAEILLLSEALDVPPILLIFPLSDVAYMEEWKPGRDIETMAALQEFCGLPYRQPRSDATWAGYLFRLRELDKAETELEYLARAAVGKEDPPEDPAELEDWENYIDSQLGKMLPLGRAFRRALEDLGAEPPPTSPLLAKLYETRHAETDFSLRMQKFLGGNAESQQGTDPQ